MKVYRIRDVDRIRPLHVVMILLVVGVVAGGMFLLSAAEPTAPVDGAIAWHEGSLLRAVVELLCLNYQAPTYYAGAIKNAVLGVGAGLATLALGLAIMLKPRSIDESVNDEDRAVSLLTSRERPNGAVSEKAHVAPLIAAQVLVALYLLWSFASSRWSRAGELALGGSLLLTIHFLWSFALGNGLGIRPARIAARGLLVVLALTAAIAVWYHLGRNPTLRADMPVGNPVFLAACLLAGILMSIALGMEALKQRRTHQALRGRLKLLLAIAALGLCVWGFYLADSRGPFVGLLFGMLAMVFFAVRGRARWIPILLSLLVVAGSAVYAVNQVDAFSPTNRSATFRLRLHAWSYAWRMFQEEPFTGQGQGAFTLTGDSYAVDDVLRDPQALATRIAHAHNEWLEVMADLGSVGLVLIVAALLLTLRAGMATLSNPSFQGKERWTLIGLMSALVGLTVSECFGVGLRVAGVPTLFYTVLGLIWAMSGHGSWTPVEHLSTSAARRVSTGVVAGVLGLFALLITQQDFTSARNLYRAREALRKNDFEQAIRLASSATGRLNPQRALTGLFRSCEAHLVAAETIQDRALDRRRRALATDPPNVRLQRLAEADFESSEAHCEQGSLALKELLLRSPSFINHGLLGYRLNLIRARNAAARGDREKQRALLQEAATAAGRELRRQPFEPALAAAYVRAAGPALEPAEWFEVLARPLRHHRVTSEYMSVLRDFAERTDFEQWLAPIFADLSNDPPHAVNGNGAEPQVETWLPERLRLAATLRFLRGEYARGEALLRRAAPLYLRLAKSAPVGAASCHAELAICAFFDRPLEPDDAREAALKAISLAPESRVGRELIASMKQRMIDFQLAAGRESEAVKLLEQIAPAGVSPEDVQRELAARYRRLCESLLGRREAGGVLRKPPTELLPQLQAWTARALAIDGADPRTHLLAADLNFHVGDDVATEKHLRQALQLGMDPDAVIQFLRAARARRPRSRPLEALWVSLIGRERSDVMGRESTMPSSTSTESPPTSSRKKDAIPPP